MCRWHSNCESLLGCGDDNCGLLAMRISVDDPILPSGFWSRHREFVCHDGWGVRVRMVPVDCEVLRIDESNGVPVSSLISKNVYINCHLC